MISYLAVHFKKGLGGFPMGLGLKIFMQVSNINLARGRWHSNISDGQLVSRYERLLLLDKNYLST